MATRMSMIAAMLLALIAATLSSASPVVAVGQDTPPSVARATPASIEQAIKQLGDEDFATREQATEFLIKAGEAAIPAAELAAKGTDPEVALRAKIVLKRLASGVRPGTSPAMASLIEDFQAADRNRKFNVLYKLEGPDEFQAIWDVIAKEKDQSQRQTYESMFRSRLTSLVSQQFRENRIDDAEALLRTRAGDAPSEAMLLTLQLATDRLPKRTDELATALAAKADPAKQRRLALMHRAAGDLPKARAAAEKLDTKDLSLWLAIEARDWPAALLLNLDRYAGKEPTMEQLAFTLLLSHHAQEQKALETAKAEIIRRATSRPEDLWPVAEALLSAEQFDEAIDLLKRGVPAAAFYLLWFRHDFEAALALAGAQEGATFDAAWLNRLPDGNLVPTSLKIRRSDYAGDIASTLHYVGRRVEAPAVLDLLRESVKKEPGDSLAWYDLIEADLRLGLRDRALEDAAFPLSRPAGTQRPPDNSYSYYNASTFNELYGREFAQRNVILWSQVLAACDGDARAALALVEPVFHLPTARKLSADQRRAKLDALLALPLGRDRYQHMQHWQRVGSLAARLGEDELAYRARVRAATMLRGSVQTYYQRGTDAFSDRDWSEAAAQLRRFEQAGSTSTVHQEQLGIALEKLGQKEEGRKYRDLALKWRVDPAAYAAQGQSLLTHELRPEAAERFRTATRLLPPGEAPAIAALNSLGNALYQQTPAEAALLWKVNMFASLMGTSDMTLDVYLKNLAVIHREQAREAIAQGRFREAADEALAELAAMPGDVVGVEQLVPLLDEKGQQSLGDEVFERSLRSYSRVCATFPRAASHRNLLARMSARCNRRLEEALQLAQEAIAIEPDSATYHATLAEVQLARGDKSAAIAAAEAGLALEPKHAACEKVLAKAQTAP